MTNVKSDYNPISIDQQVKRKLEQKHQGITAEDVPHSMLRTEAVGRTGQKSQHAQDDDLSTEFLNLLFSEQIGVPTNTEKPDLGPVFRDEAKKAGTKPFFSPLNKQEESVSDSPGKGSEFHMTIDSADLGLLELKGEWVNKNLTVRLNIPRQLDLQQKRVLSSILEKRLAHELGVKTEIVID